MFDLVVKTPFGPYEVGQRISDQEAVKAIVDGERSAFVVKVAPLEAVKPAGKGAKAA